MLISHLLKIVGRTYYKEGIQLESILVTGNTVIDALMMVAQRVVGRPLDSRMGELNSKLLILVTVHRRENFGRPLKDICKALARIAFGYKDKIQIVYPVHLNTNVRDTVYYGFLKVGDL